jgi:hypothetical protein
MLVRDIVTSDKPIPLEPKVSVKLCSMQSMSTTHATVGETELVDVHFYCT